jgi:hypothetical protein
MPAITVGMQPVENGQFDMSDEVKTAYFASFYPGEECQRP